MNGPLVADLDRRYRRQFIAYAAGGVGWTDAEDVVQDALVALLGVGRPLFDDKGTVLLAIQHAISHHRRYLFRVCRDVRVTVRLGDFEADTVRDPRSLEDAVCANVVLLAFLRALTPRERRGLFRSVFVPGRIPPTDRAAARNARLRLRALRDESPLFVDAVS